MPYARHFGTAYLRNFHLAQAAANSRPCQPRADLSLRLGRFAGTRQWLLDEHDAAKRSLFFAEAEGYRRDFRSQTFFIIPASTGNYYFGDGQRQSDVPSYQLQRDKKATPGFSIPCTSRALTTSTSTTTKTSNSRKSGSTPSSAM